MDKTYAAPLRAKLQKVCPRLLMNVSKAFIQVYGLGSDPTTLESDKHPFIHTH